MFSSGCYQLGFPPHCSHTGIGQQGLYREILSPLQTSRQEGQLLHTGEGRYTCSHNDCRSPVECGFVLVRLVHRVGSSQSELHCISPKWRLHPGRHGPTNVYVGVMCVWCKQTVLSVDCCGAQVDLTACSPALHCTGLDALFVHAS